MRGPANSSIAEAEAEAEAEVKAQAQGHQMGGPAKSPTAEGSAR
jgi:hypothetical protein